MWVGCIPFANYSVFETTLCLNSIEVKMLGLTRRCRKQTSCRSADRAPCHLRHRIKKGSEHRIFLSRLLQPQLDTLTAQGLPRHSVPGLPAVSWFMSCSVTSQDFPLSVFTSMHPGHLSLCYRSSQRLPLYTNPVINPVHRAVLKDTS